MFVVALVAKSNLAEFAIFPFIPFVEILFETLLAAHGGALTITSLTTPRSIVGPTGCACHPETEFALLQFLVAIHFETER